MAKERNGSNGILKWIVVILSISGTLISVGVIYATLSGGVDSNCREITAIKPVVELNKEHRLKDEIDTRYIKEKISSIETMQKAILEEVRK